MNGTDHQAPQAWLGTVLAAANAAQDRFHFAVSSLPEYLATAPIEGLASWSGELRSGARANLLMGVASNRVDVKIAAARTERALERVAEPLCALWLSADAWPGAELALAWHQVIRNSAHDSICACSHDLVGAAVLHRFGEAETIAEALRRRARQAAGAALPVAGPVVLNPSARARSGVVEVVVAGDAPVAGGQVVDRVAPGVMEVTGTGAMVGNLLATAGGGRVRHPTPPSGPPGAADDEAGLSLAPSSRGARAAAGHRPAGRRSWPRRGPRRAPTRIAPCASGPSARRGSGWRCTPPTSPATAGPPGSGNHRPGDRLRHDRR